MLVVTAVVIAAWEQAWYNCRRREPSWDFRYAADPSSSGPFGKTDFRRFAPAVLHRS
jgi:hypothetical protein